ncbi:MAG: hypothetical protein R3D26_17165 [Cyanobacteriota/Melainabacteria group bacterium]
MSIFHERELQALQAMPYSFRSLSASCNGGEPVNKSLASGKAKKSAESKKDVKDTERVVDALLSDSPHLSLAEAEKK